MVRPDKFFGYIEISKGPMLKGSSKNMDYENKPIIFNISVAKSILFYKFLPSSYKKRICLFLQNDKCVLQ